MAIQPTGPVGAKVFLVGEMPHEQDLLRHAPFVGGPGYELTKMLSEAGLHRENCYITMVMKDRVAGSRVEGCMAMKKKDITPNHVLYNGRWVLPSVVRGIEDLKREIELVRPNVVVAFGNLALWALTCEWGAANWRSSIMESTLVPGVKVIPTISPAVVMYTWSSRQLLVHDLKRVYRHRNEPTITRAHYKFVIRPSYDEARAYLTQLIWKCQNHLKTTGNLMEISSDIETRAGHIACIAFADSLTDAICIPLMCAESAIDTPNQLESADSAESCNAEGYWTLDQEAELTFLMCKLFQCSMIIGQNWNYDAQYIYRHWGILTPNVIDTMIQFHSCFSNLPKNLAFLSAMFLDDHLYWKDDRTNWTEGPKGEGENQYWIYNCTDAVRTLAIKRVLDSVIESLGMQQVNAFQQSLRPAVLQTMNQGIRVDTEARAGFAVALQEEMASRELWMKEVTGSELNIRSPKQMADFFYRQMGQKEIINRKTHGVTTDDEALHKIAAREPILRGITRKIAEMRSIGVFHSTFVQAALSKDGRMRSSFNICGTETYRFASSTDAFGCGCNLQNIPKGGETEDDGLELPNIRKLYIPDPGYTFFDIDLDSADLRIVTWESNCQWMKEQFKNHRKPYVEVMKEYYHDQTMCKKSHPREYAIFKSLCHGTNYLGTAAGIAPRIGLDVAETERIQAWYFEMCPEIHEWQERIKEQVRSRRYVQNAFGYRNYFFDRIEGTIFNQAVAWIPQSTVGCIINRGYVNIYKNLPEVAVLLQVHDSLAGQFQTHLGDWALRRIQEELQVVVPYHDPLVVPVDVVSSVKSWGDCK